MASNQCAEWKGKARDYDVQAARVGDLDKRCGELLRANEVFEAQLRSTASDRDDLRIRVMELEQRGQILQKDKAYFSQSNDALVRSFHCGLQTQNDCLPVRSEYP